MKNTKIIYIVDDDQDDRMLIRDALEEVIDHVSIIEAADGKILLDMLALRGQNSQPSLILLDINMPRMNGLETLAHIRSSPNSEHIPVLMLSTSSDQYFVKNAYNLGVNAYLKKPVTFSDYTYMAESVNVCFLNSYPLLKDGLALTKSFHTKGILVVEDDADQWALMNLALKQSMPGAELIRMKDTESTLDFLATGWHAVKQHPQLVLLDLYIPGRQQGLDLLEKIRAFLVENNLATLPIIIFSSSNHQDDIKACYARQANAYMVKPFNLNESISYFKTLNQFIWDNYYIIPIKN